MSSVIIIGGGIVGLATAYQLQLLDPGIKVIVLEKESEVAAHQTSHNSGVIHSGIYYKPGSEKALNCTRGYQMMLDFCDQQDIPYKKCGKVIVATNQAELPALKKIFDRGVANGLQGLTIINPEQLKEIEPQATGAQAIWVPQAGIISYQKVALKLKSLVLAQGGEILTQHAVRSISASNSEWVVSTTQGDLQSNYLVSCAGLQSDRLARMTHPDFDLKILPFRGEYYYLKPEAYHLVNTMIYPVPNPNFPFLGVHFTSHISGSVEAGPNAVWALGREAYRGAPVNLKDAAETLAYPGFRKIAMKYWKDGLYEMYRSLSKAAFVRALQKLVPSISAEDLIPGGSGVRAQACDRQGNLIDDFLFLEGKNLLHVVNAPSPAATSSLSIGRRIAEKIFNDLY